MTYLLMLAAAAGVLLWPSQKKAKKILDDIKLPEDLAEPKPMGPPPPPTYQTAMQHLSAVRQRLVHTGELNADVRSAFEVLTLELLNGSDR